MNKWAKIDEMCSYCKGHATVISDVIKVKLCDKCYSKYLMNKKAKVD